MCPQDEWNIPTKSNEHDFHIVITMNLFVYHTIIDLILILMIYVYNFKEFIDLIDFNDLSLWF